MKVFVAILVVVGAAAAAAAASISEEEQLQLSRDSAMNAPIVQSDIQNAKSAFDIVKFSVYTAPLTSRDFLPMEKFGTMGLYEKPLIVAFKPLNQNEMSAYLLRFGLRSLFMSPETREIENYLTTGPKQKVGVMLSAARFLGMPEMFLPLPKLEFSSKANLDSVYRISQDSSVVPVLMLTVVDRLPAGKDALFDLGEFTISKDKKEISISRSVVPKFLPEAQSGRSMTVDYGYQPSSEMYTKQGKSIARVEPVLVQNYEAIPKVYKNSANQYVPVYESAISRAEQPYLQNYEAIPKVYKTSANQYVPVYESAISRVEQPYLQNYESAIPKVYKNSANQYVPVYETALPHSEQFKPSLQRAELSNVQGYVPHVYHVRPEAAEYDVDYIKYGYGRSIPASVQQF